MNTELPTDSKTHADPADMQRQLEEVELVLAKATSDEHEIEADVARLESESQEAATSAYLAGKPIPTTKELDTARGRLRAVRGARLKKMAERDLLEASNQSAQIDGLIASANRLNTERQKDYEIALALQSVSARLFARSIGDLGGSYPLHGRIGRCGIVAAGDAIRAPYLSELSRISNELRAIGFTESEAVCRTQSTSVPGGEQLRGSPVVSRVRDLANRIETGLIAGELLPSSYEKTNPDVPQNID